MKAGEKNLIEKGLFVRLVHPPRGCTPKAVYQVVGKTPDYRGVFLELISADGKCGSYAALPDPNRRSFSVPIDSEVVLVEFAVVPEIPAPDSSTWSEHDARAHAQRLAAMPASPIAG